MGGTSMFYICDPEKNVECPKTDCLHNSGEERQGCAATAHSQFAKLDRHGNPMIDYPLTAFAHALGKGER